MENGDIIKVNSEETLNNTVSIKCFVYYCHKTKDVSSNL